MASGRGEGRGWRNVAFWEDSEGEGKGKDQEKVPKQELDRRRMNNRTRCPRNHC